MSNSNSQLDGLGSFNQLAQNAGTIKYGAFLNAAVNTGTIALSATFGNTSQNLGTIGDITPMTTTSTVQSNSANWNTAYTAVVSNSAVWALSGGSGDASNSNVWDEVSSYVQSNSGNFILEGDNRLTDARQALTHTHHASAITSGVFDIDRIPVIPTMTMIVIDGIMYDNNAFFNSDENAVIDGFTYVLSSIVEGTVIALNDGYRYVYKGVGGKRFASSYIQLADITPDWSVITNKPSVFTPDTHTHNISEITGLSSHSHNMSDISDLKNLEWDSAYNYVSANSASIVMTSDERLGKASTGYSYVTANSASIAITSSKSSTTYSYVTANSANIVMTSDSRLSNATTAYSYVNSNSATIVMTSDTRLAKSNTVYSSVTANSASWSVGAMGSINYTIDGGGNAITSGNKGSIQIPGNFIVQEWSVLANILTTSFVVDVRKASYANFPTTTSIVGSDPITLTEAQKNRNTSASWTNISAGDILEFYVTDASNASLVNITLKGIRS